MKLPVIARHTKTFFLRFPAYPAENGDNVRLRMCCIMQASDKEAAKYGNAMRTA